MESDPWCCLALDVEFLAKGAIEDDRVEPWAESIGRFLEVELPGRNRFSFVPFGVSLVRYGRAGRLAIHSWPERNVATVDLWMPSSRLLPRSEALKAWLEENGVRVLLMCAYQSDAPAS